MPRDAIYRLSLHKFSGPPNRGKLSEEFVVFLEANFSAGEKRLVLFETDCLHELAEAFLILRSRIKKDTTYGNNNTTPINGMPENTSATRNSVNFMNRITILANILEDGVSYRVITPNTSKFSATTVTRYPNTGIELKITPRANITSARPRTAFSIPSFPTASQCARLFSAIALSGRDSSQPKKARITISIKAISGNTITMGSIANQDPSSNNVSNVLR